MKNSLRKKLLAARDRIDPDTKKDKEASIRKRLCASFDFINAQNILLYASFRSEVATFHCIQQALKLNKTVILPRVEEKNKLLRLFKIDDISGLESGYMGIPEPKAVKRNKINLSSVDLVIIPGAGFDLKGNRLGYGAGYYDRLLSEAVHHITRIALAFEEQVVPEIPAEQHDVRMDKIITELRTIDCRKS